MADPNLSLATWWECEPARFHIDRESTARRFPNLTWEPKGAGYLSGRLPIWPFDRPVPDGFELTDADGLDVVVEFGHAYPVVEPRIVPVDPEPLVDERSYTQWHVLPDGGLCLLRDADQWDVRSPLEGLLLKAAGWRLEYWLIKNGLREAMTESGIARDPSLDHLWAVASGA